MAEETQQYLLGVAGIIHKNGRYILVQEGDGKDKGKFNLPAGKCELGESIIAGLKREVKEESGFEVEPQSMVYVDFNKTKGWTTLVFDTKILGGDIMVTFEHPVVEWFDFTQIKKMEERGQLRFRWIVPAIENYRKQRRIDVGELGLD
ncbi:NUDIX domain-containing protein [Candidatus Woesearchaeota archaeon]|nr:NUDIX domain-containing protein [Candidatus Woesearchaeota archaeon]